MSQLCARIKEQLYQMLKCFMIDLITRQYYGDLSVYALLGEDIKKYDWMRHIPHMQKNKPHRNIVCDNESKNNIFEYRSYHKYYGYNKDECISWIFNNADHIYIIGDIDSNLESLINKSQSLNITTEVIKL